METDLINFFNECTVDKPPSTTFHLVIFIQQNYIKSFHIVLVHHIYYIKSVHIVLVHSASGGALKVFLKGPCLGVP